MSALVFLSKIQFCKDLCCCSSVDAALISWKHPSRRHYSITQPWGYKASHMNCSLFIFPFIRTEHPIENWSLKCSMIFFFFFFTWVEPCMQRFTISGIAVLGWMASAASPGVQDVSALGVHACICNMSSFYSNPAVPPAVTGGSWEQVKGQYVSIQIVLRL